MHLKYTLHHAISSVISTPGMRKKYKVTARQGSVHLSQQDTERIGILFDEIYNSLSADLGERDRRYIYRTLKIQKTLEVASRTIIFLAKKNFLWNSIGAFGLGISKIIENMEIGHNVMHGQYDWMGDPALSSQTYEWDNASPSAQWKRTHNKEHHYHTNITGLDNDLGYGIIRVDRNQPWEPIALANLIITTFGFLISEYAVAAYETNVTEFWMSTTTHKRKTLNIANLKKKWIEIEPLVIEEVKKITLQVTKDYIVFPLFRPRYFLSIFASNLFANIMRNVWTQAAIFCGHFPSDVQTFSIEETQHETRGEWYVRQLLGSCNIYGSKLFHFMTGNLSHQIEHHLFPQIPAHRLGDISGQVRQICEEYRLPYHCGPFVRQLGDIWWHIAKCSLPNKYSKAPQKIRVHIERAHNPNSSLLPQKVNALP